MSSRPVFWISTVAISALISSSLGQSLPQDVADEFGAKCLNGNPPTYAINRNISSTQWVLFLEGGGWCQGDTANSTKQACAGRAGLVWPPTTAQTNTTDPASLKTTTFDIGGVMGQNSTTNPDFYTWNKVWLHYCDGASFGSGRVEPVNVSTKTGEPAQMWMRGRNNFNGMISYLQTTLGMGNATEVILSGGSAGGLGVFYNLDHLATLLPTSVRLTGFPDAGFFLDTVTVDGVFEYRNLFIGADPVWNVTGSGGTNLKCLAANVGSEWKCLMAGYLVEHIETPLYVMNAGYDAYQMGAILQTKCIPYPGNPCTADQNASMFAFRRQFVKDVAAVTDNKPNNGVYLDSCYVHEQNVNYCSGQGMPNCVGWSPLESGSLKWGYKTSITISDGRTLTPQQAFGAYYRGDRVAAIAIDDNDFFNNPSCHYLGKSVPPNPCPNNDCCSFAGAWVPLGHNNAQAVTFVQSGCSGSFVTNGTVTYTVHEGTITTSNNFYNGLQGVLEHGVAGQDLIAWGNGAVWAHNCSDFGGDWIDSPRRMTPITITQAGCAGSLADVTFTVEGNVITTFASSGVFNGLTGVLTEGTPQDKIAWSNVDTWERTHKK